VGCRINVSFVAVQSPPSDMIKGYGEPSKLMAMVLKPDLTLGSRPDK